MSIADLAGGGGTEVGDVTRGLVGGRSDEWRRVGGFYILDATDGMGTDIHTFGVCVSGDSGGLSCLLGTAICCIFEWRGGRCFRCEHNIDISMLRPLSSFSCSSIHPFGKRTFFLTPRWILSHFCRRCSRQTYDWRSRRCACRPTRTSSCVTRRSCATPTCGSSRS